MTLTEGLYGYEIVMLVLGALLFVALLVLLIMRAARNQSLKNVLYAFAIPLVMIGYPGIQKLSIMNGLLDLEKNTHDLARDPRDPVARRNLERSIAEVQARPVSTETAVSIAEARVALGDTAMAVRSIDSVLLIRPNLEQAIILKQRLDVAERNP